MSLYMRLWITTGLVMLLTFVGSFMLSNLSSRDYFEQQLERKNFDNATTLGLLLSSPSLDSVTREVLISAQFDSGHYQFIRLTSPDGTLISEHTKSSDTTIQPSFLQQFFPIAPAQGIAQVSDGWKQIGTLAVGSHTGVAYDALWQNSVRLFGYFCLAAAACGLICTALLRLVTRPLEGLVEQAVAITERRFITRKEPETPEFRNITQAMNHLSLHVQQMLEEESARLDSWRINMQYDPLTGLMNRQPCLAQFHALLERNDASSAGSVMLIQLQNLAGLNDRLGRAAVDQLLKRLGQELHNESRQFDERLSGRLNGSDLLLVVPGFYQTEQLGQTIYQALLAVLSNQSFSDELKIHCVATPFRYGDTPGHLLDTLNHCLLLQPSDSSSFTIQNSPACAQEQQQPWQKRLDDALSHKGIQLQYFPTVNVQRQLSHLDACARLKSDSGPPLAAGVFMASLRQMGWCYRLDQQVLSEALQRLEQSAGSLAISLSASVLREPARRRQLVALLSQHREQCHRLQLEFASAEAFLYLDALKSLCQQLKPLGCKVGLKHMGHHLSALGALAESGLDYARIDGAFVRQLDDNNEVKTFIQGLCSTLHAVGITVLAEQVSNESQWQQLLALGIDGGTGPLFSKGPGDGAVPPVLH